MGEMKNEKDVWQEKNDTSTVTAGPAANADLVVVENDFQAKLESIEISAEEANWFLVIIRKQDATNPSTKKVYRLKGDGQLIYKESFDEPIMSWGAGKEIAVQNVNAGTGNYGVNIKTWERKA